MRADVSQLLLSGNALFCTMESCTSDCTQVILVRSCKLAMTKVTCVGIEWFLTASSGARCHIDVDDVTSTQMATQAHVMTSELASWQRP